MSELNYDTTIATVEGHKNLLHRAYARGGFLRARAFARFRRFNYDGDRLPYWIASYNQTWVNERCVELAIVAHLFPESGEVLEVGNVWKHYRDSPHTVVDKYEQGDGVINSDVVEIPTGQKYDFVFSISTFEHVGWDEVPQEPEKLARAIEHVRTLLAEGGQAAITVPVGWNDWLDAQLADATLDVDHVNWLVRTGSVCNWREATSQEALATNYGSPRPHANGLAVLILKSR